MMGWRFFSGWFLFVDGGYVLINSGFGGQDGVPCDFLEFIGISQDGVQFVFVISTGQNDKNIRFISATDHEIGVVLGGFGGEKIAVDYMAV